MNGIDDRPVAVGSHFDTASGKVAGDRATANRVVFTMALIVAPGIVTLAKPVFGKESRIVQGSNGCRGEVSLTIYSRLRTVNKGQPKRIIVIVHELTLPKQRIKRGQPSFDTL